MVLNESNGILVVDADSDSSLDVGTAIKLVRAKRGLTTTELARRVGISQAQISRLENGKQGFRTHTLGRIAREMKAHIIVAHGSNPGEYTPSPY